MSEKTQGGPWTISVCPVHGERLQDGYLCHEVVGYDDEGTAIFCHESEQIEVAPTTDLHVGGEAAKRIDAVIDRAKGIEKTAHPIASGEKRGVFGNALYRAQGEAYAAEHLRELLEEPLPESPLDPEGEQ